MSKKLKKADIALIAHDGKKSDMVAFVMKRLDFFRKENVHLFTTGTTGEKIEHAGVTNVTRMNSGPYGGDAEIGAMVANKKLDAVIFFRDPLDKHPHEVDVSMLMRLCDVHDIALATNYSAAHMVIKYFKEKVE